MKTMKAIMDMESFAKEVVRLSDEIGSEIDQIVEDFAEAVGVDAEDLYEKAIQVSKDQIGRTKELLKSKTMQELANSFRK